MTNREAILKDAATLRDVFYDWGIRCDRWFLVDGHALYLLGLPIELKTGWRRHFNVYVDEAALPWQTVEAEETIPPMGSRYLDQLVDLAAANLAIHIVPARRYLDLGVELAEVDLLRGGERIRVTTLRGAFQIWVLRATELCEKVSEIGSDLDELCATRLNRLFLLNALCPPDLQRVCSALAAGYAFLRNGSVEQARAAFSSIVVR